MLAALKINILACTIKTAALKSFMDVRAPGSLLTELLIRRVERTPCKRKLENGYRLRRQFRLLAHGRARGTSVL
jgi:hypothetical protein